MTGWLPGLARRRCPCHLVWCVQTAADYAALAGRLPPGGEGVDITVYVTRAEADVPLQSYARGGGDDVEDRNEAVLLPTPAQPTPRITSSSAAAVSLGAALVGMFAAYWGYYVHVAPNMTLLGYTVTRRCLPIVLVAVLMVAATAVGSRVLVRAQKRRRRADMEGGLLLPTRSGDQSVIVTTGPDNGHDVRVGRPDFDVLVRAAVVGVAGKQRVVVAACGPTALVAAARKSVKSVRKEHRSVCLEFSGSESSW